MAGEICPGCDTLEFEIIQKCYRKDTEAIQIFRNHGVLPMSSNCPKCNRHLLYYEQDTMWRCHGSTKIPNSRKRQKCGYKISDRTGTFLEKSHLAPWQVLLFANSWVRKHFSQETLKINLDMSYKTIMTGAPSVPRSP